jgi:hypothetical protein
MKPLEILIYIIFLIGIGIVLIIILRDPIFILKTFLRGLKPNDWRLKILLFPLWGPIWLIDKIFKLELYIKDFKQASHPKQIDFVSFQKFILIKTGTIDSIKITIKNFYSDFNPNTFNYSLVGSRISYSQYGEQNVLKIEGHITFNTFNNFTFYLDKHFTQGILICKSKMADSYYLQFDTYYPQGLIGRTYSNNKIYVDLNSGSTRIDMIYLNSNINYIEKFNFNKFSADIETLHFTEIII